MRSTKVSLTRFEPPWCLECLHRIQLVVDRSFHDPVKWYTITHAGTQVAQWDFQNKATRTSPPWPTFAVFEVPLCYLRPGICDFAPRDRIVHSCRQLIVPLHISVTWYGINYAGTQMTQWDLKKEEKSGWTGKSSFLLKVPLRYLRSAQHNLFLTMLPDRAIKGPIV